LKRTGERDDFCRFLGNFFPPKFLLAYHSRFSGMGRCRKYRRALGIEPQNLIRLSQWNGSTTVRTRSDLHPNAGSPSALNLVFMSEQYNTGSPPPVVKRAFMTV